MASAAPVPLAVSVVATVLNERESLDRLLCSLAEQTRRPDEVVIVDGGSADGTWEQLERRSREAGDAPPLVVRSLPGANISAGRNAAIQAARGPVIAATDAGVRLEPGWLEAIAAPFESGAQVVAGFFVSDPEGAFETALGATTLPEQAEIDPERFLPSSRSVAFRRDAWRAAGGYPEWLDYCEDLVFDLRLLALAGPARFAPQARVRFRPRPSLGAFARQYYRYARGDGKADLWLGRHLIRYASYLVLAPLILAAALGLHPGFGLMLPLGLAAMTQRPYRRLRRQWGPLGPRQRLLALAWVPLIRITGDLAKMAGYPVGRWWRLRHHPPEWRPEPGAGRI